MSEILAPIVGTLPAITIGGAFLVANAAGAAAIAVVAFARPLMRRLLGPEAAYALWSAPPLAALLGFIVGYYRFHPRLHDIQPWGPTPTLWILWGVGAMAVAAVFAISQARFAVKVRAGRAGPAVVGLISPHVVMPRDDGAFTAEERELIRAHEREHVARKDPRAAAGAALAQCVCWFNPFVHLAASLIRLDQELVCDAAVVLARPKSRGLYARTLLKTQLAATPLPFGCYWAPRRQHPLELRVEMLRRRPRWSGHTPGVAMVLPSRDAIRP